MIELTQATAQVEVAQCSATLACCNLDRFGSLGCPFRTLGIALKPNKCRAGNFNFSTRMQSLLERVDPCVVIFLQHQWLSHRHTPRETEF